MGHCAWTHFSISCGTEDGSVEDNKDTGHYSINIHHTKLNGSSVNAVGVDDRVETYYKKFSWHKKIKDGLALFDYGR